MTADFSLATGGRGVFATLGAPLSPCPPLSQRPLPRPQARAGATEQPWLCGGRAGGRQAGGRRAVGEPLSCKLHRPHRRSARCESRGHGRHGGRAAGRGQRAGGRRAGGAARPGLAARRRSTDRRLLSSMMRKGGGKRREGDWKGDKLILTYWAVGWREGVWAGTWPNRQTPQQPRPRRPHHRHPYRPPRAQRPIP